MVYNYQSRCGANGLRTKLQLSGEDLVRSLHAFRKGLQNRPVVFVGHSFGGLVIQHVSSETFSPERLLITAVFTTNRLSYTQNVKINFGTFLDAPMGL